VKRFAAPLVAAVLLVIAAAGFSSEAVDDYCITLGPAVSEKFGGTSSSPVVLWPPGRQCRYETASGKVIGTEHLGDVAGFTIMLVAGAVPDLWNGTTLGWALLLLLVSLGTRPLDAADDRLMRYFAGPRADF
jgi:hypothetical protein